MAKAPPHFCVPDTLAEDLLDKGLSAEHLGLIFEAWQVCARNQLDGKFSPSRAVSLRLWDEKVARELVIVGAFRSEDDGHIELVGYLDDGMNKTREQIRLLRDAQSRGGKKGGATRTAPDAPRLPDGTLPPATCPYHGTSWKSGKYGFYCSEKAKAGEPANGRGYCTMTPDKARDTRDHSGLVSGPVPVPAPVGAVQDGASAYAPAPPGDSSDERTKKCGDCGGLIPPSDHLWLDTVNNVYYCHPCAIDVGRPSWLTQMD